MTHRNDLKKKRGNKIEINSVYLCVKQPVCHLYKVSKVNLLYGGRERLQPDDPHLKHFFR